MKTSCIENNGKMRTKNKRLLSIKINLDFFVHIFCFLSVLFIGADIIGIDVGINFRLDQVFLCVLTLLLIAKCKYRLFYNIWIILFAASSFVSTVFAYNTFRGILFYCSILYNIFFIFYTFSSYVYTYGFTFFVSLFRRTYYVLFVIFLLQYVLKVFFGIELPFLPSYGSYGGVYRFSIWFYEPSYLATYLIFWFALSCYMLLIGKDRSYIKDVVIGLIMLILCTATTGFLGIALTVVVVYIIWLSRGIRLNKILVLFAAIVIVFFLYLIFNDIFDVFIGRLFAQSWDDASGGRISLWAETWNVFIRNPLCGVGPGNYGLYLGQDAGYVPSNVTLELLSTLGIFATFAFYCLSMSLIYRSIKLYRKSRTNESMLLIACAFGLIVFTIILQANQGYLRLYHWMFWGFIYGGITYISKMRILNINE